MNVAAGTTATDAVNLGQLAAAGLNISTAGVVQNAFVAYDSTAKTGVTLGSGTVGAQLHQLAAGTVATDAVNLGQLAAAGLNINTSGVVTNAFVAYDTTAKTGVTLGSGTVGAQLHQLVAGTAATDAVNVGQLTAAGLNINTSGVVQNAFVAYDTTAKTGVTLGVGTAGAQIHGLVAGVADTDATNVAQLKAMGATFNSSGVVQNSFVAYDTAARTKVTLGDGTTAVTVSNVAAGVAGTDAVNVNQLNSAFSGAAGLSASLKYIKFGPSTATQAQATQTDSMAIGGNAFANASGALAFGLNARATGNNSVAIGVNSSTSIDNTVSFGTAAATRRLINVGAGVADTDAVNLGQVDDLIAQAIAPAAQKVSSTPVMATRTLLGDTVQTPVLSDVVAVGPTDKLGHNEALSQDGIAIGLGNSSTGIQSVAIGSNVSSTANTSVGLGYGVIANGDNATAIGVGSQVIANEALAIGYNAQVETVGGVAIGNNSLVTGAAVNGISVGSNNQLTGAGNVVVGNNTLISGTNTVAIGNNIFGTKSTTPAVGSNSVILGNGSDGSQSNVVSIGAKGSERKIVNVAAGTTTTDAVNLGQMTTAIAAAGTGGGGSTLITQAAAGADLLVGGATQGTHVNFADSTGAARELTGVAAGTADTSAVNLAQLKPVVAALGGGAAIDAAGKVTGPTYSIGGHTTTNAGDAFKDVDTGLTNLNNAVAAISADTGGTGLVAQDPTTQNITVGKMTGGTVVDVTNSSGVQRTITGVAAGAVNSSSFDAINGSQLFNNSQSIATAIGGGAQMNSDGSFTQPTFNVGGGTVHNVGDAISNLDSRVTQNADNVTNLQTTVNNITAGGGVAAPNAVSYDSSAHDQITMAGTAGTKLTNLAAGTVAAGSTDAVTGDQLYSTNQAVDALQTSVTNIATTGSTSIGINGTNGADGAPGTPAAAAAASGNDAIAMGDNASAAGDHAVVIGGGASGTGDGTIAIGGNAGATGTNSIAIGNGATAPNANSVALGAGSTTDRDNSVSVGSADQQRQITNVAAGTQGTDAVNLNQMNSAVGGIARKAYSGIAAATALTMIPDVDANKTLSIGIGGGTFQGYAASAIGGTARITQNIKVRVGAGWSAAGTTVGAGASYQW